MIINLQYLPIQGTHAWSTKDKENDGQWWHRSSKFASFLAEHGLFVLEHKDGQFVWSTDLDGLGQRSMNDWVAAGKALKYYMACVPYSQRNLIVHSHGLQPALFACADGLKIRRLVSVCSPVRKDMMATAKDARPNIGRWLHIYALGWKDKMARLGQLFDGNLSLKTTHPLADINAGVKGAGHSSVICEEEFFHHWVDDGWIEFLKAPAVNG